MLQRQSKRHEAILEVFAQHYPALKIEQEVNFGNNLFVDIYLPEFCIGMEIYGEQHSTYNPFLHRDSVLNFYRQQINDRRKNLYFKENSLFLYRVSYADKRTPKEIVDHMFTKAKDYFENIVGGDTDNTHK